ncbi:Hypothetical protein CINCED_3A007814 [Cinara cedri]|uniref:Uncharacterized protein n=1 Tax=Cinara cedri TaxID=506608 RepID=A0A5E4NQB4_9HEMI|nr:Hypothetical protein CINCED_3A007814 [Cinara cedri]
MDYNSIDEDDVEKLRLAALMSLKKKSNVRTNTISSTSGEFCHNKYLNGTPFNNPAKNNRGRFTTPNRLYNQRIYTNVGFRRPPQTNNNLIAIIPTESESDTQKNGSTSINIPTVISSEHRHNDDCTKPSNVQNLNNEVSTKFSRLENESGSEESEDSEAEKEEKEESDDGDVLFLGEEDEDLDDLDKLMDIMEAEIAGGDIKSSKKEKKSLKQNNKNKKEKNTELRVKSKLNIKEDEPIVINQPKVIVDTKSPLNIPEEELESIKTLEEIRNSKLETQCSSLKSRIPLRSPSPLNRKKSISPYSKIRKRSPLSRSPRRRSPSLDRYRYSPVRFRPYRRSLSPRRSPRRFSPLREKNLSPRRYSPKSRYPYRSPSPRRRRRSLSREISPSRRRLSPLRRRSRSPLKIKSKSRSPKLRLINRRRSPSPIKKVIRSRPVSPNIRRKDNKTIDDDHFKKREKVKIVDKLVDSRPLDPVLEARKRKFESNKPIEPTSKKIILKKTNSVQVAIQTENNEKIEPEIKPKTVILTKKVKTNSQSSQAPKNISITTNNDSETVSLRRIVKVDTSPEKINSKKRPRIVFGHDDTNEPVVDEDNNFDQHKENQIKANSSATKVVQSETLEVSSTSEGETSEENDEEESENEDRQELSESSEEYIEEEEEEEVQGIQEEVDDKESIQRNNTDDLRTELKRRRALRLNMIQVEVKKKPESFYPARLLQSAIRGVVGSSNSCEVKIKKHSKLPEINIKTNGYSDGRRVIVMNRDKTRTDTNIVLPENEEDYNDEVKSYASVKRLKGKLKKVPVHLRTTGLNNDRNIQKGLRKIIKRNVNVTDFDQM